MPAILWLVAFFVVPLLTVVVYSFGERPETGGVELGLTARNYARLANPAYMPVLMRTLRLAGMNTIICLALSIPLAWHLAFDTRGNLRFVLLLLIAVPVWVTLLVRVYAWFALLRPGGILPAALVASGLCSEAPRMLFTEWSMLVGLVTGYLPLMVLPIYAALERLARTNLLPASADLGATPWQTFLRVVLPIVSPGIWAGVVMVFVPSLGSYIVPSIMGGNKVNLLGSVIADSFLITRDYAQGSAMATVLIAVMGATLWLLLRRIDRELPL